MKTVRMIAGGALLAALVGCVPPKVDGVPPTPVCQEETGDLSPKVYEVMWTYPNPPTEPVSQCLVSEGLRVDTWINLAEGSTIVQLLCYSIGGIPIGGPITPQTVWLVCADTGLNVA